jgi:hypothetical protein
MKESKWLPWGSEEAPQNSMISKKCGDAPIKD